MGDLVFLCHRIPWPPDKGDKIRSAHLLQHLARTHRVHLATFIDDPRDLAHVDRVKAMSGGDCLFRSIAPGPRKLASLAALATGEALSCRYYDDRTIDRWFREIVTTHAPAGVVAFSSTMAQYVIRAETAPPCAILDMVDVDSEKFRRYAADRALPARWIYAREARKLLEQETLAARRFDHTVLVTRAETDLFAERAPGIARRLQTITNGVDHDWFDPAASHENPYGAGAPRLLFTGAMDYAPNVEAALWFLTEALPAVLRRWPQCEFWIVGANPSAQLRRAASPSVRVTGRVADMRPYLAHADLVVAPMLTARGVQNKILEAFAMGRPVVTTPEAAKGLDAVDGEDLIVASPARFVDAVLDLLSDQPKADALGERGRAYVRRHHVWPDLLAGFDRMLATSRPELAA